jgi:hypothetical protein
MTQIYLILKLHIGMIIQIEENNFSQWTDNDVYIGA